MNKAKLKNNKELMILDNIIFLTSISLSLSGQFLACKKWVGSGSETGKSQNLIGNKSKGVGGKKNEQQTSQGRGNQFFAGLNSFRVAG